MEDQNINLTKPYYYWNGKADPSAVVRRLSAPYYQDKRWFYTQESGDYAGNYASVGIGQTFRSSDIQAHSDGNGDGNAEVLLIDSKVYQEFFNSLPKYSENGVTIENPGRWNAFYDKDTPELNGKPFGHNTTVSELKSALDKYLGISSQVANNPGVDITTSSLLTSEDGDSASFDPR